MTSPIHITALVLLSGGALVCGYQIGAGGIRESEPEGSSLAVSERRPQPSRLADGSPGKGIEPFVGDPLAAYFDVFEDKDPLAEGLAFCDLLESMDAAALGELVEGWIGFGGKPWWAQVAALERWVELDPAAASVFARGRDDWTGDMLRALLALRDGVPALGGVSEAGLYVMALRSPMDAVRFLNRGRPDEGWLDHYESAFRGAGMRLGEALPAVLEIDSRFVREDVLGGFLRMWARVDAPAALATALQSDDFGKWELRQIVRAIGLRWHVAESGLPDLTGAMEPFREAFLAAVVSDAPGEVLDAAMASGMEFDFDGPLFLELSKHAPPEKVAELAVQLSPDIPSGGDVVDDPFAPHYEGTFLRRWASENPEAVVAWLSANPGWLALENSQVSTPADEVSLDPFGLDIAPLERFLVDAMRERGFARATAFAESIPEGALREAYTRRLMAKTELADFASAQRWIDSLPEEQGIAAGKKLAGRMAEWDRQQALEYWLDLDAGGIVKRFADGRADWVDPAQLYERTTELGDERDFFARWVDHDPRAAVAAAMSSADDVSPGRVAAAMGRWVDWEPSAASEFISKEMPPGRLRDSAVVELVDALRKQDPAAAVAWAQTVGEPAVRYSLLESLAKE